MGAELDSRDITVMSEKMAQSIAACPHIMKNPKKPVLVVMKGIENETQTLKYLSRITLARIRAQLNRSASRSQIVFVMELKDLKGIIDEEKPIEDWEEDPRVKPGYALKGRFLDHPSKRGVYYLCTFQVAHLASGMLVWEDSYEVKRLRAD